jgi:nucleoid DNA-binding protein
MAVVPKLKKSDVEDALVFSTGYTRSDVRHFMSALDALVATTIKDCRRLEIAGIMVEPKLKAPTKKRIGRNPATGAEITIKAKPASVRIATRATKPLENAKPRTRKLAEALGVDLPVRGSQTNSKPPKPAKEAVKGAQKGHSKVVTGKGKKNTGKKVKPAKKNGG